ncbi:hypothetical protein [Flavobacterium sp.]|uniref:hypothetical protein n=1 Tax=Flavobacterium sp. TaxID=239 RepID=UPI00120EA5B4|nr:hypothetical protein [Flavobacterium sp.]RZJ72241.1 MAG: hypothetical protein EOO49_07255 [Flavobacterium sp.]
MKKWLYLMTLAGIALAFYEQSKPKSNPYLLALGVILMMFGILKLSSILPSKNQNQNDGNDAER